MLSRLLVLLIASLAVLGPARAAENPADKAICAAAVAAAEQAARLPVRLLRAVSLAESGRWDPEQKASFAWPWTVTSGGAGQYFPDKASAIAHVKRLQAKGVKNIDVGCMQVNLMHHGQAFSDLEEAFDPIHNVLYAAAFLRELRVERNSWSGAVATYHSADRERGNTYSEKVFALWHKENEREFRAALAARDALYASRAAARQNQLAQR
jgi:hypothetical protein